MLVEVYNKDGKLVLDNETIVLTPNMAFSLNPGHVFLHSSTPPNNVWYTTGWVFPTYTANNPSKVVNQAVYYYSGTLPTARMKWVRPRDGTTLSESPVLSTIQVQGSGNYPVAGGGADIVVTSINDAQLGFIECYNESGQLTWSLSSLLKAPQVLRELDMSAVRSIDLAQFPSDIREKIYFCPLFPGDYNAQGVGQLLQSGVNMTRIGTTVYFGDWEAQAITATLLVGYLP